MFWGWGSKTRQKKVSDKHVVMNRYRYFHFMFLFNVTWGYKYILATQGADGWSYKDIPKEEATRLTGGDELMPNWWMRFSLYFALVSLAISITLGLILAAAK